MEDDNTQILEVSDSTRTFPKTGDSPPEFAHHEQLAEDSEATASNSTLATEESSSGTCRYPVWDHLPPDEYSPTWVRNYLVSGR